MSSTTTTTHKYKTFLADMPTFKPDIFTCPLGKNNNHTYEKKRKAFAQSSEDSTVDSPQKHGIPKDQHRSLKKRPRTVEERKAANRRMARESRERRKHLVSELNESIIHLTDEKKGLMEENELLKEQFKMIKYQIIERRHQLQKPSLIPVLATIAPPATVLPQTRKQPMFIPNYHNTNHQIMLRDALSVTEQMQPRIPTSLTSVQDIYRKLHLDNLYKALNEQTLYG